jgi:hypothetical protein
VTHARFRYLAIVAGQRCGFEAKDAAQMVADSLLRKPDLVRSGTSPVQWVSEFQREAQLWDGDSLKQAELVAAALVSDRSFMDDDLPVVDRAVLQSVAKAKRRIAS